MRKNGFKLLKPCAEKPIGRNSAGKNHREPRILFSGIAGLTVSYFWGCSAGAAISLCLALIFALTFACRKAGD